MPPEATHTICVSAGLISGEATEAPMNSTNHTSTRRAMQGVVRRVCMDELLQIQLMQLFSNYSITATDLT